MVSCHLGRVRLEPDHEVSVLRVHPDWGAEVGLRPAGLDLGHEKGEFLDFNILK